MKWSNQLARAILMPSYGTEQSSVLYLRSFKPLFSPTGITTVLPWQIRLYSSHVVGLESLAIHSRQSLLPYAVP